MSRQLDAKEMVQRILAVAEILSTVAAPEEIRAANQGRAHNVVALPIHIESNSNQQPKQLGSKR